MCKFFKKLNRLILFKIKFIVKSQYRCGKYDKFNQENTFARKRQWDEAIEAFEEAFEEAANIRAGIASARYSYG